MLNKTIITYSLIIIATVSLGLTVLKIFSKSAIGLELKDIQILAQLPAEIERTNPVPEARTWNSDERTFYYFNWGFKPTSGYDLTLLSIKGNTLVIQASAPSPDMITAQVITYPHLLLSLPKGDYDFTVVDEKHRPLPNIFKPQQPALELTILVPSESGSFVWRRVLRDPTINNEGKPTIAIALEALFAQPEMMEYLEHDVTFEGISFSSSRKECSCMLSQGYQSLSQPEKDSLNQLILKTILANDYLNPENIKITIIP